MNPFMYELLNLSVVIFIYMFVCTLQKYYGNNIYFHYMLF